MIGLFVVDGFDYVLQQMFIVGFIVVFGLLVDNFIVIMENIEWMFGKGLFLVVVVVEGIQQLVMFIGSVIFIMVLVFVFIVFMFDVIGVFIVVLFVMVIVIFIVFYVVVIIFMLLLVSCFFKVCMGEQ